MYHKHPENSAKMGSACTQMTECKIMHKVHQNVQIIFGLFCSSSKNTLIFFIAFENITEINIMDRTI